VSKDAWVVSGSRTANFDEHLNGAVIYLMTQCEIQELIGTVIVYQESEEVIIQQMFGMRTDRICSLFSDKECLGHCFLEVFQELRHLLLLL
jgi:hypothetical protein